MQNFGPKMQFFGPKSIFLPKASNFFVTIMTGQQKDIIFVLTPVSGDMTHSQSTGILNGSFLVNFYFPNLDHQKLKKQHFLESIFGYYNDFLSLLNLLVLSLCVSSA